MMDVVLNTLLFLTLLICASGRQRETRVLMEEYSLESIVDKLNNLTARVAKCEAAYGHQAIAFKAHLTQSLSPGNNERIVFDDVQLNLGNAYHSYGGVFVAPYNGTYMFSVSICSTTNHYVVLDLMRNNDVIGRILAGDTVYDDCSSETTVTVLHAGDDVYVKHHLTVGDYIHYQQHTINSFTGTLLQTMQSKLNN